MDDFDTEIQSEETFDHDPEETCSECGCRVIDCECVDGGQPFTGNDWQETDEEDWADLHEDQFLDMMDDNPVMGFDY